MLKKAGSTIAAFDDIVVSRVSQRTILSSDQNRAA
jgi:hypothetical protein